MNKGYSWDAADGMPNPIHLGFPELFKAWSGILVPRDEFDICFQAPVYLPCPVLSRGPVDHGSSPRVILQYKKKSGPVRAPSNIHLPPSFE